MRKLALLSAALLIASVGYAKPTTVKGAKCTACHEGAPKDKKYNKATTEMLKKYKEDKCKDCHGWDGSKLTTTKK